MTIIRNQVIMFVTTSTTTMKLNLICIIIKQSGDSSNTTFRIWLCVLHINEQQNDATTWCSRFINIFIQVGMLRPWLRLWLWSARYLHKFFCVTNNKDTYLWFCLYILLLFIICLFYLLKNVTFCGKRWLCQCIQWQRLRPPIIMIIQNGSNQQPTLSDDDGVTSVANSRLMFYKLLSALPATACLAIESVSCSC